MWVAPFHALALGVNTEQKTNGAPAFTALSFLTADTT